jgi:hypothetical protein
MNETRVCASVPAGTLATGASTETDFYEGIELDGEDRDKLIAICDAVLFYCQVARLRTRPSGSPRPKAALACRGVAMRLGRSKAGFWI